MPLDALRAHEDPSIAHPERLAFSIDTPRIRRRQRWRTVGRYASALVGWCLVAVCGVVWSGILWLVLGG